MTIASHVEELKKKHSALSRQVEEAQRAPGMNSAEIASMKKRKLKIKEEISRLAQNA